MALPRVGWIGLGIMGKPMASNLRRAGFEVIAYNRSAERLGDWRESGGRAASSPREAAVDADVLVTMVSDTADVESVLFGAQGAVECLRAGSITVDMSTISPSATRGIAQRLRERGIAHLDAPVSGGESGAITATLSIMVGGEPGAFERCREFFDALGKRVTFRGRAGAAKRRSSSTRWQYSAISRRRVRRCGSAEQPGWISQGPSVRSEVGQGLPRNTQTSGRRSSWEILRRDFRCA